MLTLKLSNIILIVSNIIKGAARNFKHYFSITENSVISNFNCNFFQHIDIDPANVNILDGNAPDLELECQNYEQKITEAGTQVLPLKCYQKITIVNNP